MHIPDHASLEWKSHNVVSQVFTRSADECAWQILRDQHDSLEDVADNLPLHFYSSQSLHLDLTQQMAMDDSLPFFFFLSFSFFFFNTYSVSVLTSFCCAVSFVFSMNS